MNSEILKSRAKRLAIDIIKYTKLLPESLECKIIISQLIRSVTSTAANYRTVLRARSNAEFYSKISVVVEEIDETLFWIELINDAGIDNSEKLGILRTEATELLYIFSATRKSSKTSNKETKINKSPNQ